MKRVIKSCPHKSCVADFRAQPVAGTWEHDLRSLGSFVLLILFCDQTFEQVCLEQ